MAASKKRPTDRQLEMESPAARPKPRAKSPHVLLAAKLCERIDQAKAQIEESMGTAPRGRTQMIEHLIDKALKAYEQERVLAEKVAAEAAAKAAEAALASSKNKF